MRKLRGNKVFLPKSQCSWINTANTIECFELTIACGKNILKEYVLPCILEHNHFVEVTDAVTGEKITINTNYVVEIKSYNLVFAEYMSKTTDYNVRETFCFVTAETNLDYINKFKPLREFTIH